LLKERRIANSDKKEVAIMVFLVLNVIKTIIDIVSGAINIVKSIKNDFTASDKNNKKNHRSSGKN